MGWFEKQIEERKAADQQLLEEAILKASGVVLGEKLHRKMRDEQIVTKDALEEVLKYFHCKGPESSEEEGLAYDQLEGYLRPHGIMYRTVLLEEGWYRDAFGPLLAFTKEEELPVALLPGGSGGYFYTDPESEKRTRAGKDAEALFKKEALCFYRPLPQRSLKISDLMVYMKDCVGISDVLFALVATLAVMLIGVLLPRMVQTLTGPILQSGRQSVLVGVLIAFAGVVLSSQLMGAIRQLWLYKVERKVSLGVESSMMMRILSLPPSFFRAYSPGELRSRAACVQGIGDILINMVMNTGLTSLGSLIYVTQIFRFAPALVIPSLLIVFLTVGVSVISLWLQVRLSRKSLAIAAKESGLSYGLITGVEKLKLSGAEKRSFAKWLNVYSDGAKLAYDPPLFLKISSVITTAIGLFGNILLYYMAIKSGIEPSGYFAFTAAYGMLLGAFLSVAGIALGAARIQPMLEMAEPFLKAVPETSEEKELVTSLKGRVELDHVSFRYEEDQPYVIKDLSLSIEAGEYVAIVGKTGCGKSTLVRLLLGFETPEMGAIYYDGKDLSHLDLATLRRKIGTVMQNAGLFQGDIYSNIVITAPNLSMDEAWEAAALAGIDKDIREMPMGMYTLVSEGGTSLSGGQRQRLMIARAVAPKPKILIFDEATSALDNKTQKQVSDALDQMGCTRIVIAHRLSTIRHCHRIVVLDGGRIIEEGSYEELMAKQGFFADLVERQRLEGEA